MPTTTNEKGRVSGKSTTQTIRPLDTAAVDNSTATEVQERRIIEALRQRDCTTDDLRALGIYQVSARVFGLRRKGWDIRTVLFDGWSADGYRHSGMARYSLLSGPEAD